MRTGETIPGGNGEIRFSAGHGMDDGRCHFDTSISGTNNLFLSHIEGAHVRVLGVAFCRLARSAFALCSIFEHS